MSLLFISFSQKFVSIIFLQNYGPWLIGEKPWSYATEDLRSTALGNALSSQWPKTYFQSLKSRVQYFRALQHFTPHTQRAIKASCFWILDGSQDWCLSTSHLVQLLWQLPISPLFVLLIYAGHHCPTAIHPVPLPGSPPRLLQPRPRSLLPNLWALECTSSMGGSHCVP